MLKVAVVLLVVLLVLLGLPLGIPTAGASMCPECDAIGGWALVCVALVGAMALLMQRRAGGVVTDRFRTPLAVTIDALERPPRAS